ncbi:MAG: hypothetical protein MUC35_06545 [Candidatus Margulisbacteria bacterium]|jgi:hypothetical protein|nr:hypothetical protein [Candidatus Margulisiibacteriota bacterium]
MTNRITGKSQADFLYKATPGKFWDAAGRIRTNYGVSLVARIKDKRIDAILASLKRALPSSGNAHFHSYVHATLIALEFDQGDHKIVGGAGKYRAELNRLLAGCRPFSIRIDELLLKVKEEQEARILLAGEAEGPAPVAEVRKRLVEYYGFDFPITDYLSVNLVTFNSVPGPAQRENINALLRGLSGRVVGQRLAVEKLLLVHHQNNFLADNLEEVGIPLGR